MQDNTGADADTDAQKSQAIFILGGDPPGSCFLCIILYRWFAPTLGCA